MFPQDLIDGFIVFLMIAGRIGLPIALVMALGYWLQRSLRTEDQQPVLEPSRHAMPKWFQRIVNEIDSLPAWLPTITLLMATGGAEHGADAAEGRTA